MDPPPRLSKRAASPNQASDSPERKKFRCDPCNQGFTTRRALLRHSRESKDHRAETDASANEYRCHRCAKNFARASGLERHTREQHGKGKAPCPRCKRLIRPRARHSNANGEECVAQTDNCSQEAREPDDPLALDLQNLSVEAWHAPSVEPIERKQPGRSSRPRVSCGICHREFETHSKDTLFAHLKAHLEDLGGAKHVCIVCKIAFVHPSDLDTHMQRASKGHCGFVFHHRVPCTGHHALPTDGDNHDVFELEESDSDHRIAQAKREDRADFLQTILNWELAQLQVYSHSTKSLLEVGLPTPKCFSAPPDKQRLSISIATCTHSAGVNLAYRPGKRWTAVVRAEPHRPRKRRTARVLVEERTPTRAEECSPILAKEPSPVRARSNEPSPVRAKKQMQRDILSAMRNWDSADGRSCMVQWAFEYAVKTGDIDIIYGTLTDYPHRMRPSVVNLWGWGVVQALVNRGADPRILRDMRRTPLVKAVRWKGRQVAELLGASGVSNYLGAVESLACSASFPSGLNFLLLNQVWAADVYGANDLEIQRSRSTRTRQDLLLFAMERDTLDAVVMFFQQGPDSEGHAPRAQDTQECGAVVSASVNRAGETVTDSVNRSVDSTTWVWNTDDRLEVEKLRGHIKHTWRSPPIWYYLSAGSDAEFQNRVFAGGAAP